MKIKALSAIFLSLLLITACSSNEEQQAKEPVQSNTVEEAATQDIKELVHEYSVGDFTDKDESASITSHQLIVTKEDDSKVTYDLPEDEFFVSIAPYVNTTHPCSNHSLTDCQGEMVDQEFDVKIVDKDGNVVLDQVLMSQANGFIDLWLPRDNTYVVTIEHGGKSVKEAISTFEGDNTCITTMQLK